MTRDPRWRAETAQDGGPPVTKLTMHSLDRTISASVPIPLEMFEDRAILAFYLWQLRRGIAHARAQRGLTVSLHAVEDVPEPVPGS